MTTDTASPNTLNTYLASPLDVGAPDLAGPLTVFPIFGPEPKLDYLAFAQASADGVTISELDGAASVNDLVVTNPTGDAVLLFDGEEILGAQQNRTLDVTVLVAADSKLRIPVSCVEAGRWDARRHRESLRPSPQAAYPRMRRMKAMQVRAAVAAGSEARASQSAVWDEAADLVARHDTDSPTGAIHDVYERRRDSLDEICAAIPCHEGQVGSIAAFRGELQVLDYVSRPAAYEALHRRLVQGYALDALDARDAGEHGPPEDSTARGFALLACDSQVAQRNPGVGLGEDVRFASGGVAGSGLVHDGELIQLTAFPGDEREWDRERVVPGGRIRRPSRRQR